MLELIIRYLSDKCTPVEREEVEKWRENHPEEFFEYKKIWAATEKTQTKIENISAILNTTQPSNQPYKKWWLAAASIAMLIVISIFYLNSMRDNDIIGISKTVALKDGSTAVLFKDSKIEYLSADQRSVKVSGRVYFEVKPSKNTSFVVWTDQAKIQVIGTSFLVSTETALTTEVIVATGLVEFGQNPETYLGKPAKIELKKGEKGIISPMAKGLIKQNNRNENYLAWANQTLYFKNDRLNKVAELIEEVYGYKVTFSNRTIANCVLTATYSKKNPQQIARIISETFGFTYTITEDKQIIFDGKSCQ